MSHNCFSVVALCTVFAALAYASPSSGPSAKFAELSDQFVKESLALSPTNASAAGYHKHVDAKTGKTIELDALLDDLSLKGIDKQRAFSSAGASASAKRRRLRLWILRTPLTGN